MTTGIVVARPPGPDEPPCHAPLCVPGIRAAFFLLPGLTFTLTSLLPLMRGTARLRRGRTAELHLALVPSLVPVAPIDGRIRVALVGATVLGSF